VDQARVKTPNNSSPWVTLVNLFLISQKADICIDTHTHTTEACFLSAIHSMARKLGKEDMAKEAVVRASVHIGTPDEMPGFGLAVDLKVDGVDQELLDAAHAVSAYSLCPGVYLLILLLALPLQSCFDQGN